MGNRLQIVSLEQFKSLIECRASNSWQLSLSNMEICCEVKLDQLFNSRVGSQVFIDFIAINTIFKMPFTGAGLQEITNLKLEKCTFEEDFILENCRLSTTTSIVETNFNKRLSLLECQIQNSLVFSNIDVKSVTKFFRCHFSSKTEIIDSHFGELVCNDSNFHHTFYFVNCTVQDENFFTACSFNHAAGFKNSKFKNTTSIISSTFNEVSTFEQCEFNGLDFSFTDFASSTSFNNSNFENEVLFHDTSFSNKVTFNRIYTFGNTYFSFLDIFLSESCKIYFEFDEILETELSITPRKATIVFNGLRIETSNTFMYIANLSSSCCWSFIFENCQLHQNNVELVNVALDNHLSVDSPYGWKGFRFNTSCQWPSKPMPFIWFYMPRFRALPDESPNVTTDFHARASEYALLKANSKAQGDSQLASDFYAWQMWWSLQENSHQFWKWVYYRTSVFGLSVLIPFLWLVLVSTLFWVGYYYLIELKPIEPWPINTPITMLTIAAINPFNYQLDFSKQLSNEAIDWSTDWRTVPLTLVFIAHRIIALYLYFQAGSAIRSRVKI